MYVVIYLNQPLWICKECLGWIPCFCFIATSDYTARSGEVTINDADTRQCISIPIREDSSTENLECFTFGISLSNTVNDLTIDPDEASICIVDKSGKNNIY